MHRSVHCTSRPPLPAAAALTLAEKERKQVQANLALLQEDYVRQLQQRGLEDSYELLTDREREILQLVAEGKSNKEVAAVLDVSVTTMETHRGHILQKLGLPTVPELILYAVQKCIIS